MTVELDAAVEEDRRVRPIVLTVLSVVVAGSAVDLYLDKPADWFTPHVLIELALMFTSAAAAVFLWRAWRRTAHALVASERSRTAAEVDRRAWQSRAEQALRGMAYAIDQQFDAWKLTPAEREVALMLLKGHGHKQIAFGTGRSESTVRQHAVSVYGKSGQGGRAELAAFFLEGLMLPAA